MEIDCKGKILFNNKYFFMELAEAKTGRGYKESINQLIVRLTVCGAATYLLIDDEITKMDNNSQKNISIDNSQHHDDHIVMNSHLFPIINNSNITRNYTQLMSPKIGFGHMMLGGIFTLRKSKDWVNPSKELVNAYIMEGNMPLFKNNINIFCQSL